MKCICSRKGVRRFLLWFLAILVVLMLILQFGLGAILKSTLPVAGKTLIGTPISIQWAYMCPFLGKIHFKGFSVGAPEGFEANVFDLAEFKIDLDVASLPGSGPIHIREILIDKPVVSYELKGLSSNINAILAHLQSEEQDTKKNSEEKPARKVIIDRFVFSGGRVRLAVAHGKGAVVPLPTIELRDIGAKSGGATTLEAVYEIIKSIGSGTVKAVSAVVGDVAGVAVDAAAAVGSAAADAATAVGTAAIDVAEEAASAVGDAIGGGLKAVGSIFGGSSKEAGSGTEK